ncbi:Hpt domain-containing protein [Marinomonas primoryensis]|jgi:two-component system sensor histidine kinase/response regulator|uniref:Hpt domain-containing protein n=1 Tax=Marinomonas primoryensis TaxID=178399 RepID=UPI003704C465
MPIYVTELSTFASHNADLINRLLALLSAHKYQEIKILAHAIKGISGNLALLNISNSMVKIERTAQTKNYDLCLKSIHSLSCSLSDFTEELQQLKGRFGADLQIQPTSTQVVFSKIELLSLLDTLTLSAGSGEVDDENIDLLISIVPKAMKRQAIEVSNAISDFDFNSAIITLANLKKLIAKESDR